MLLACWAVLVKTACRLMWVATLGLAGAGENCMWGWQVMAERMPLWAPHLGLAELLHASPLLRGLSCPPVALVQGWCLIPTRLSGCTVGRWLLWV